MNHTNGNGEAPAALGAPAVEALETRVLMSRTGAGGELAIATAGMARSPLGMNTGGDAVVVAMAVVQTRSRLDRHHVTRQATVPSASFTAAGPAARTFAGDASAPGHARGDGTGAAHGGHARHSIERANTSDGDANFHRGGRGERQYRKALAPRDEPISAGRPGDVGGAGATASVGGTGAVIVGPRALFGLGIVLIRLPDAGPNLGPHLSPRGWTAPVDVDEPAAYPAPPVASPDPGSATQAPAAGDGASVPGAGVPVVIPVASVTERAPQEPIHHRPSSVEVTAGPSRGPVRPAFQVIATHAGTPESDAYVLEETVETVGVAGVGRVVSALLPSVGQGGFSAAVGDVPGGGVASVGAGVESAVAGVALRAAGAVMGALEGALAGEAARAAQTFFSSDGPAPRVFHFAHLGDPMMLLGDAIASFADESVALAAAAVEGSASRTTRAWAVTAAVVAIDAAVLAYWYRAGKRRAGAGVTYSLPQ